MVWLRRSRVDAVSVSQLVVLPEDAGNCPYPTGQRAFSDRADSLAVPVDEARVRSSQTSFSFASGCGVTFSSVRRRCAAVSMEGTGMRTKTGMTSGHAQATSRIRLRIAGMSCSSCVASVRSALTGIAGIHVIDVAPGSAVIELLPGADTRAIGTAIASAGYEIIGIAPLHAQEQTLPRNRTTDGGGCCCGPDGAHQDLSPEPAGR